jgi:hypothetical protein
MSSKKGSEVKFHVSELCSLDVTRYFAQITRNLNDLRRVSQFERTHP